MQYIDINKKAPNIAEINAMYSQVIAQPMHCCEHLNWIVDQLIDDTNKEDEPCYLISKPIKKQVKVESSDDEIIYQICQQNTPSYQFGADCLTPV